VYGLTAARHAVRRGISPTAPPAPRSTGAGPVPHW